ncbi:MAG: thymidine phosphorylase [Euryarchaeota archaeon]|nr:thymidine phosphorylase [Euryarchaeota archaeon]|tara:strand:+ start:1204 stop:2487 length:1284 start_codon:yes stop_codon:yes gene_type:complete
MTLTASQLHGFSQGIASGEVSNAQIAAFTMAVYFQDLSIQERVDWTNAVKSSGFTIDWSDMSIPGPILDKHSTGGIGDGVSLMLAPMLAACGAYIPMIAGRGLAHTGGTIDKLESFPGYNTGVSIDEFKNVVRDVGYSIIRQTDELAPTDSRVYSVRDVTATVESIGLITASIISKKLAAGINSLVLDVKTGNGAVMQSLEDSRTLAKSLVDVSNGAGVKTSALITDMSQPLSFNAGNSLEILESIEFLKGGKSHPRLSECVYALGSQALVDSGLYEKLDQAATALKNSISSGLALEKFAQMVDRMGGDTAVIENTDLLPQANIIKPVYADRTGYVNSFDLRAIGMSIVSLGGGRTIPGQAINHSVGLQNIVQAGSRVTPLKSSQPLCFIHASTEKDCEEAERKIIESISIDSDPCKFVPLFHEIVK